MRAIIQRVSEGRVAVAGTTSGAIGRGVVALVGIGQNDGEDDAAYIARKLVELRIFEDDAGKMNLSLTDIGGEALIISQFTLYADTRKGRRPSFVNAAQPEHAEPLYERVMALIEARGIRVVRGAFGARMQLTLTNDGPVTIWLDSAQKRRN